MSFPLEERRFSTDSNLVGRWGFERELHAKVTIGLEFQSQVGSLAALFGDFGCLHDLILYFDTVVV